MALSIEEVKRVAHLARLSISEAEAGQMAVQLSKIVELVDRLREVNTDNVEPMVHAIDLSNVLEPDIPRPSMDREEALMNAPVRDEECFRVPAVLG